MSLICGKWQLTKKRQSGNISLFRDRGGNIHSGNYSQEILRRLAIVIWLEEEDLCTVLVFCPNEFPVRREDKIVSPPRNKLLYLSDSERSFLCIFLQKKVPFIACKDFGQDAQNARVANWWRQCIESAIGKNAGKGGNVAIGLGANWARQHIIRYITDTIQSSAI